MRKVDLAISDLDANSGRAPVISPDGSRVAFVAGGRLRVRRLDSLDVTELPDSDDVAYPSWSPDSRQLAYIRRGRAWKVSTEGGAPTELGPVPLDIAGSAGSVWMSDGQVVFAGSDTIGLWTVPAAGGGSGREMLALDRSDETDFHEIATLPDNRGLIFTVHRRNRQPDMIAALAGGSRKVLLEIPGESLRYPVYSPTGHLLYERETTNPGIWAVPFSLQRLETTGAPMLVVPRGRTPSLASDGTLAFVRPDEAPVDLVRVSRSGTVEKIAELAETNTSMVSPVQSGGGYRPSAGVSLSPDGTRLAVNVGLAPGQLLVHDLQRGSVSRVATGTFPIRAVWGTRDDRLIYASAREARGWNLWSRRADGAGEEKRLSRSDEVHFPLAVSPDGSALVFVEGSASTGNLFQAPADASAPARSLFQNRVWGLGASFSPDGRWLAYESFESGRMEVFVRPFPDGDQRIQVSSSGGQMPAWSKTREIFYVGAGGVSAVSVTPQSGSLAVSKPVVLFPTGGETHLVPVFDPTPDGQHFLMLRSRGSQHLALDLQLAVGPCATWRSQRVIRPVAQENQARIDLLARALSRELIAVRFLQLLDRRLEALRIDEAVGIEWVARLVFLVQLELRGVRREKNVDRHVFLRLERPRVVVGDAGVLRHAADGDARVDGCHVGNHHAVGLSALLHVQREAGRSLRVTGMMMRGENGSAERDRVVVLERAVDLDRFELRSGRVAETEVQLAAGLEQLLLRLRDDDSGAGHALQLRQAGDVVVVSLRSGQDFGIGELEAELLHAGLDFASPCRRHRC